MKKTNLMILALAIMVTSFSAWADSSVGNGGGGIKRNGEVLTFGKAGYTVRLTPLPSDEIPGMERSTRFFKEETDLLIRHRSQYLRAIIPSFNDSIFMRLKSI